MYGIYAYDELYLLPAQRMLGDMYDFAVNTLQIALQDFQKMFLGSTVSRQIQWGNPMYLAGKNGCEVAREVILDVTGQEINDDDEMYADKSPEYWIGWTLAYIQWETGLSFLSIEQEVPIEEFYEMYPTCHEADVSLTVEILNQRIRKNRQGRQLKRLRKYADLSQQALADKSHVALRQIQLFEQGQRDLQKTQAVTLLQLSRALGCRMEDLLM